MILWFHWVDEIKTHPNDPWFFTVQCYLITPYELIREMSVKDKLGSWECPLKEVYIHEEGLQRTVTWPGWMSVFHHPEWLQFFSSVRCEFSNLFRTFSTAAEEKRNDHCLVFFFPFFCPLFVTLHWTPLLPPHLPLSSSAYLHSLPTGPSIMLAIKKSKVIHCWQWNGSRKQLETWNTHTVRPHLCFLLQLFLLLKLVFIIRHCFIRQ